MTARGTGAHQIEAFLEMMSAERGAAPNTLASYCRDLEDHGRFLAARGSDFAGSELHHPAAWADRIGAVEEQSASLVRIVEAWTGTR